MRIARIPGSGRLRDLRRRRRGYAVRPAFHLNLESASARAGSLGAEPPTDVTSEYTGSAQTIANVADAQKSWYDPTQIKLTYPADMTTAGAHTVTAEISDAALAADSDYAFKGDPDTSKGETATKRFFTFTITKKPLSISWTNDADGVPIPSLTPSEICGSDTVNLNLSYEGTVTSTGAAYGPTATKPKNAGNYTITILSLSNANYDFATGAVKSKSFTLDIRNISEPTLLSSSWWAYNGNNRTYAVNTTSYDPDDIEITVPTVFMNDPYKVGFDSNTNIITVKNVNDKDPDNYYYLNLSLKDKDNTWWADTHTTEDRQLKFKLLPYEVELELNGGSANMSVIYGEDTDMDIEITDNPILTGHTIVLDITATFNGVVYKVFTGLSLDEDSADNIINKTLSTSILPLSGVSYTINAVLQDGVAANGNFHITCNTVTAKVDDASSGRDTWRITKSTGGYFGSRFYTTMGTTSVAYTDTITYDGVTYGIEFTPSTDGHKVDTTYNSSGYINGYMTVGKIASNTAIGKNADEYTTTVRVLDTLNGNAVILYTITWTISPYTFDLSKVTWKNNGVYEYTGSSITPSLDGLPSELKLSLFGAHTSGTAVQSYGSVTASFSINTADGYVDTNYVLPENGVDGSYTGTFTWTLSNWEITPMQIKLTWDYVSETDDNGLAYQVLQLKDTSLAGIVDYEYYLTDSAGNILETTPYTLDDIVVSATTTQYFKTLPVITMGNEGNYKFPDGSLYSPVYSVGGGASEIIISLTTDQYTYTGKGVSLKWKAGTPTASLDFKYYIGDAFGTAIDYVPTEVGTYWVEVTSKNSSVVLGGDTQFQFWINKSVIPTDWKTSAKPPVLAITKSIQLDGIEYEYYDEDMHKITFSDLSAGGTFYIRAILKDTKNFEFDNGDVQTDTIQFTLAAGEDLRDPSDISNPNYDFDDEDEDDDDEKPTIPLEWDTSKNPPELKVPDEYKDDFHPEYEYFDKEGNPVKPEDMVEGEDYTVKVKIPEGERDKFNFVDKNGNPIDDFDNIPGLTFEKKDPVAVATIDLGAFGDFLTKYWQPLVIGICTILIIIFLSKTAGYESKRKKYKKKADKLESSMFAAAAPAPLWGLAYSSWTALAIVAIALAVASLVIMIIAKNRSNKAQEEYEEVLGEYQEKKEEKKAQDMRMMFMGMNGGAMGQGMGQGMAQGMPQGFAYTQQPAFGLDEMRGMITETVSALLPSMQQALPQQAGTNDALVQKLVEQNARNEEVIKNLAHGQQELMKKLAERPAEIGVAASSVSDEAILKVVSQSGQTDEDIKQILRNQERLMEKILDVSMRNNQAVVAQPMVTQPMVAQPVQPQIIEKEVVKEVPVEKIVEKEVKVEVPVEVVKEVPVEVEKIVEKEVPVEVERIIEKEVVKEVPVEKIVEKEVKVPVEVEKIVEVPVEVVKEVPIKVEVPVEVIKEVPVKSEPRPKKEIAPRLTLDEAYALLTKEQKKFFDGLKQYVLDKYKCKEKKATYFVTYGQTATNPLLKLMIKKDITVALLKMEDELMKDIRRDATGDGTKVKVKETEVLVTDSQAFETAKKMIDLRYDQIERYADLLKEQRALRRG